MSYNMLASYYDALMLDVDYGELLCYYEKIWEDLGLKPGIVLDLACGTGSLLPYLEKSGYDPIGVDISPEMLAAAKEKCSSTLLLCQDICRLDLYGTIDAAVCSLDGINSLLEDRQVIAALSKVNTFLADDGVFIFDINSPHKLKNILCENTYVYDTDGVYCIWESFLDGDRVDFELTFFAENSDGLYNRFEDTITERIYSVEHMTALVSKSGLILAAVYGDKNFQAPTHMEERIFFVARKGKNNE